MFCRVVVLSVLLFPMVALAQATSDATVTPKISEEQARAAALKVVPGRVTSVEIEKKRGKHVYVVEIRTRSDAEKDVHVDIETGQVLRTED
ncbi:MAG: PepSY domain-containing protein [Solimonas sp.]